MTHLFPFLALSGALALAYWNSFGGVFQFDDFNVIVGNPDIHSWQAWLADAPSGIRPFLKFTYMLNWTWGVGAFGFHLFNTLVHLISAFLIYHLSRNFLKHHSHAPLEAGAWTCALIFALHPRQTEAVTYISGRSTSLMALLYLGSLMAYAQGCDRNNRYLVYLASPLLFILAVLTKETAVTLPLALLLWERTGKAKRPWRVTLKNLVVHASLLGTMSIVLCAHHGYLKFLQACFRIRGWAENLLTQVNALPYLISRLFLVHSLNIDPDLPGVREWDPLIILAGHYPGRPDLPGAILSPAETLYRFRAPVVFYPSAAHEFFYPAAGHCERPAALPGVLGVVSGLQHRAGEGSEISEAGTGVIPCLGHSAGPYPLFLYDRPK